MNIRLGNWVAGDPKNAPGTIQWAGGLADFSKGPFNMYVQSLKVINYSPAASYAYNDMSGSFQSIGVLGAPAQASLDTSSGDTTSTGPGAVPFSDGSDSSGSTESMPTAAAAAAPSGPVPSGAQPSVVSINLGGSGAQGAAAAANGTGKLPCSTVTKSGPKGTAAAATGASNGKASVVSINLGKPSGMMGPGAAAATAMSGRNSTSSGQGIVAQGAAPANGTLPTVTIKTGGQGQGAAATSIKTGITTAAPAAGGATGAAGANGGTSFAIGSSTTSARPQQQTTNAGSRLEMGGAALAAVVGLMAVL
jgi:hypothetical protein